MSEPSSDDITSALRKNIHEGIFSGGDRVAPRAFEVAVAAVRTLPAMPSPATEPPARAHAASSPL